LPWNIRINTNFTYKSLTAHRNHVAQQGFCVCCMLLWLDSKCNKDLLKERRKKKKGESRGSVKEGDFPGW